MCGGLNEDVLTILFFLFFYLILLKGEELFSKI